MFKNPVPLNMEQHRGLRFSPNTTYAFAAQMMLTPFMASESRWIARDYVLAFSDQAQSLPVALLGAQQNSNSYVNEHGHWQGRYVPAHIRRYPFALGQAGEADAQGQQKFAIMLDTQAAHFTQGQGEPLLDEQGQPTALIQRVQAMLVALQKDQAKTLAYVKLLEELQLLVPKTLQVQRADGSKTHIDGLRVIDQVRWAKLPEAAVLQLHQSGAMVLVHAHLLSLTNLQNSPLCQPVSESSSALQQFEQAGTLSFAD